MNPDPRLRPLDHVVILSPRCQVAIPPDVRRVFRLEPGQELALLEWEGRIVLAPMRPAPEPAADGSACVDR